MLQRAVTLVVGGDGRIGRPLVQRLRQADRSVVATSRRSDPQDATTLRVDLSTPLSAWSLPRECSVAVLLAAITSTAVCEAEPERTRAVNVEAMLALARLLASRGAHLVVLSTNMVLSGEEPDLPASAPLNPQGAYATQKAELEAAVIQEELPASILRLGKVADSLEPMLREWAERLRVGLPIRPFRDLRCSPVPLMSVIDAIVHLADLRKTGIYQLSGDRDMSYAQVALILARRLGADEGLVHPVDAAEAGSPLVGRGPHTTLDSAETLALLGVVALSSRATIDALVEKIAAR